MNSTTGGGGGGWSASSIRFAEKRVLSLSTKSDITSFRLCESLCNLDALDMTQNNISSGFFDKSIISKIS